MAVMQKRTEQMEHAIAFALLEKWADEDRGFRTFHIRYNGPTRMRVITWTGGWSVCLRSKRWRRRDRKDRHTVGWSLLRAVKQSFELHGIPYKE